MAHAASDSARRGKVELDEVTMCRFYLCTCSGASVREDAELKSLSTTAAFGSLELNYSLLSWYKVVSSLFENGMMVETRKEMAEFKRTHIRDLLSKIVRDIEQQGDAGSSLLQQAQVEYTTSYLHTHVHFSERQSEINQQYKKLLTDLRANRTFSSLCKILNFTRRNEINFFGLQWEDGNHHASLVEYNSDRSFILGHRRTIKGGPKHIDEQEARAITLDRVQNEGLIEQAIGAGAYSTALRWIRQLYSNSVVTFSSSLSPSSASATAATSFTSSSTLTQLQQQNSVEPLSSMWNRLPESIKSSFEHELHQLASHREFILGQYYHHLIDSIPHGLDPTMMMTAAELESLNSIDEKYVNQSAIQLARLPPQPCPTNDPCLLEYQETLLPFKSALLQVWHQHSIAVRPLIVEMLIPDLVNIVCEYLDLDPIEKATATAVAVTDS